MIFLQKVMDILPKMVESLGFHKQYKAQLILFYWEKIVGTDIAAQSCPVNVEYGTLFISVKNSVWCHHLLMMKTDLIQKVNAFVGDLIVKDVRFKNHLFADKIRSEKTEELEFNLKNELKEITLDRREIEVAAQKCKIVGEDRLKRRIFHVYRKHLILDKYKRMRMWHLCAGCETLCPKEEMYCSICELERKRLKAEKIRGLLREVPWATYGEINQHEACSPEAYIDAKLTLLSQIAEQINDDDERGIPAKTLTMLFTGAKHDELNPQLVQKTMAKFRRKVYVSTPRS